MCKEGLGLLKVYWNLAWFGGIHVLSQQWTEAKGDPRFSAKLMLENHELSVVKESFSEAVLEEIALNLPKYKTHKELSAALHKVKIHLSLLEGNDEKYQWAMGLPWIKGLSRFLRIRPTFRNDEKIFLVKSSYYIAKIARVRLFYF